MKNLHHCDRVSRLSGVALLALAAALPARADYQSTVLSQSPVGYWRLDDATAPTLPPIFATNAGSVGASGNGTYSNGVIRGVAGAIVGNAANGAARFPQSTGNRIRVPYASQWNQTGPFSVEFWAKPAQTGVLACPAASVEFIPTPTQRNGWLIYQGDPTLATGAGFVFRQYNSTGLANQTAAGVNLAIDTNQWYHIVATFDGTSLRLYTNGLVGATTALAGTARNNTNSLIPLGFGARSDGSQGFFEYAGDLDECAVYTTALSAGQVLAHYQAGTNAAPATAYSAVVLADAPAGYWRLGEPSDPPAVNAGTLGAAANGKYIYNALPNQAGPRPSSSPVAFPGLEAGNKAAAFDGAVGSVTIPSLGLNTNRVTITAWVKPNGGQAAAAGVFNNSGSGAAGIQFDILTPLGLSYNWNNDPLTVNWDSAIVIPDSQWSFVALIVHPDHAVLFVPGQTPATNTLAHAPVAFDGQSFIGNGTAPFNGVLDEVALFNNALGLGAVYSQYAAAVGGLGPQIFSDPQSTVDPVIVGDTLTLSVDAGGTPNLSYQWRKESANISGATTSAFSKPNLVLGDAGNYDVVVTNLFGAVTSGVAVVTTTIATVPVILQGPVGRTVYPGGTLNLNVVATGGGLHYQWKRSATNLPGATGSAYIVPSVTTNNAGSYTVTVTNSLGTTNLGPAIVVVPTLQTGTYAATVAADGPEAWWRLDDSVATTGSTMLDSMGRHDGVYTNAGGLTVGAPGAISGGIAGTAASFTGDGSFGVVPYSSDLNTHAYTLECWVKLPSIINGVMAASSHQNGTGYGIGTQSGNWYGFVGITGTDFIFGQGPGVTAGYDPTQHAGQWVHLVIISAASGQFPCQIFINGATDGFIWGDFTRNTGGPFVVGGFGTGDATIANRSITAIVDEVAVYKKALTPAQIQAHYAAANFGVPPSFTTQPVSQNVFAGQNANFSVGVVGSLPITLQWKKNGASLAGQTNATLTVSNLYYTATGDSYTCAATNAVGFAISTGGVVTVYYPPTFANDTNGLVLHLKFDGNYLDTSGHGNNATAVGAPTFAAGKIGSQALAYDTDSAHGTYDYLTLGTPADLLFGTSTDFSVAYWVKLPAGYTNGDLPFLCSSATSYGDFGFTFAPSYTRGGWSWSLVNSALAGAGLYGPDNTINDGNWHSLVHTFTRTGNGVTFLDGLQVNVTPIAGLGSIDTAGPFNIGQASSGTYGSADPLVSGSANLDDLGVWRVALTDVQARSIYYAGQNGKSFDTFGPIKITMNKLPNGDLELIWEAGTLKKANSITGPWTPVAGAAAPYYRFTPNGTNTFFGVGP